MDISYQEKTNNVKKNIIVLLVYLFFLFTPFYFLDSGLPQFSDVIGIFIMLFTFVFFKNQKNNPSIILISFCFFTYILVVNSIWGIILSKQATLILPSLWYLYNFLIMLSFIIMMKVNFISILKAISIIIPISLFTQLLILVIAPGAEVRGVGSFNNPNQLGYYALLHLSLYIIISKKYKVNMLIYWLVIGSATFISFFSLSRSAILSIFILILIELFSSLVKKKKITSILLSICILITLIIPFLNISNNSFLKGTQIYKNVEERFLRTGMQSDDDFVGRGYGRITEYPEYLFFGAGEGVHDRFYSKNMEIHSTLGNIYFSYGIFGLLFFSIIILICIYNNRFLYYFPLLPILFYGITHNGIRNPVFWIILAVLVIYKEFDKNKDKSNSKTKKV